MITLNIANKLIENAFKKGTELGLMPLSVIILDKGGHVIAFQRQDGASNLRFQIAHGKAYGALAVGKGSRWLDAQAATRPHFLEGLSGVSSGQIVPVPGGVLVKSDKGQILGAVGITGDSSDNDETCAIAAIETAGFVPQAD